MNYNVKKINDVNPQLCQQLKLYCFDLECKAIECLGPEQRQQLWNYMRLAKVRIGILYNFAPTRDQCEHYYLDTETDTMYCF